MKSHVPAGLLSTLDTVDLRGLPDVLAADRAQGILSPANARSIVLRSMGIATTEGPIGLPERATELLQAGAARLEEDDGWFELAIAALSRVDLEIVNPALSSLGFIDSRRTAGAALPNIQVVRDFNFDKAMELFVETTCQQDGKPQPERSELESRFIKDGRLQLFVSTKQENRKLIGNGGNVGDNFGLHVTKHLFGPDVLPFGLWADPSQPLMLTVGSIMKHAMDRGLIWGSGCIQELRVEPAPKPTNSIFLGVRGPRSREQMLLRYGINPAVIGDPGVLIREVCAPGRPVPDIKCGFIIHSVDKPHFRERWPDAHLINNTGTPHELAADVLRCEYVVSSSLHGLIFTHALGVPCVAVKFGDRLRGDEFKFLDYLQSAGIYGMAERIDLSNCGRLETSDWIDLVEDAPQPSLKALKQKLVETFPFPAA